ncbi:response regulator transcription factor [Turicibacter sanguinis]|uniref:response regulator transcription factor n=1 Tax=Turicibacter sanguinis TaxID=154288 RepID=UPI00399AFA40
MDRILIVDDDQAIAYLIADALEDEGFEIIICHDGNEVLEKIEESCEISLMILDIMMPKMDGLELCRRVRDQLKAPIIFVSAKSRTLDTLLGLEMGADDYICKPFVVEELVARVKAHLRREKRHQMNAIESLQDVLQFDRFKLYLNRYEVFKDEVNIDLSPREFQLFQYFVENSVRVLSREQIFDAIWGENYGDIGTVAVNIKNLRQKLDPDNQYIKTIWGVGYKLVKPEGEGR